MSLTAIDTSKRFLLGRRWPLKTEYTVGVDAVTCEVLPGQTLGVVGESGSGKSTLARLMLGLLTPSAGHIEFEGKSVASFGPGEWRSFRQAVQPIFQDPRSSLNWRHSIERIITEPLQNFGQSPKQRAERSLVLLEQVRLPTHILKRQTSDVSGGQLQRVAIARALALDPRYLICDEPLSALDVSVQAGVLNLLLDLQASRNLAMMFISHDLEVVRHVSDRVIVMYRGAVMEDAPAGDLYRKPRHPYTQVLLGRSAPLPEDVTTAPSVASITSARGVRCPFTDRCPTRQDRCFTERPKLRQVEPQHRAACHFA
ncbi:MAG TPA: oligopeptide/dipeptide ABC transporter ATP-binding protein [Candidatus Micrarchaeaceae archaeon]|nr:oligopeptide/dipeptide ABC transporter ATP-binding protein [Candidatus Micrarchaeaceae archaeon]